MSNRKFSDTITVTSEGRTVVDVRRLFAKKHMREMIHAMRSKTRIVTPRRPVADRKEDSQLETASE